MKMSHNTWNLADSSELGSLAKVASAADSNGQDSFALQSCLACQEPVKMDPSATTWVLRGKLRFCYHFVST